MSSSHIPFVHFTTLLPCTSLRENFVVSLCSLSLHFVFHFTWRQLCRFPLYLVTTLLFFTSHHFCFSLHFEKTLSFHFVPCHFTLFFTSLGDNFVVSLCTSSLHSCFSLHTTFVFHFTWRQSLSFHFVPRHFTPVFYNTIQHNFIAKCQYTDCTRNVLWCQVHSSHIHSNHKPFNYNSK